MTHKNIQRIFLSQSPMKVRFMRKTSHQPLRIFSPRCWPVAEIKMRWKNGFPFNVLFGIMRTDGFYSWFRHMPAFFCALKSLLLSFSHLTTNFPVPLAVAASAGRGLAPTAGTAGVAGEGGHRWEVSGVVIVLARGLHCLTLRWGSPDPAQTL